MADPGFPRGGRQTLQRAPSYDFGKFSQKLHEIERIWTPKGGGGRPLDPPMRKILRIKSSCDADMQKSL